MFTGASGRGWGFATMIGLAAVSGAASLAEATSAAAAGDFGPSAGAELAAGPLDDATAFGFAGVEHAGAFALFGGESLVIALDTDIKPEAVETTEALMVPTPGSALLLLSGAGLTFSRSRLARRLGSRRTPVAAPVPAIA